MLMAFTHLSQSAYTELLFNGYIGAIFNGIVYSSEDGNKANIVNKEKNWNKYNQYTEKIEPYGH